MLFETLLGLLLFIVLLGFAIGQYNEAYWKRRGVKFHQRNKEFGLFWDYVFNKQPFFELLLDIYKKYPEEKVVAFGSLFSPSLYVKDIENHRHITRNDFQSFQKRGIPFTENDKLAQNLLIIHGQKWKLIRQKMTPLFTSAKLKNMYYIMDRSAREFVIFLMENPEKWKSDGFETMNHYCCAAIAASVFGIGTNSTFDSPFLKLVQEALETTTWKNIKITIGSVWPRLFETFDLTIFSVHEKWFIEAIRQVIRQREIDNVKKHDFADLCVSLQKNGVIKDPDSGFELEPTDEILAAQAFFFFLAGLDPCASTMFNTLVELGRNPNVLKIVHEKIDQVFQETGGDITYETVVGLDFLDNVIDEALRLYPPIAFTIREASKDTVLPNGNIKVDNGTKIYLPVYEYHHDEKYFENPEVFDAERFDKGKEINDEVFVPFGRGHRICIGIRYAKLQMKTGLLFLLRNFTVKTVVKEGGIKFSKQPFQVRLSNVDIEFVPRN